jgi:FG-GAP repeat
VNRRLLARGRCLQRRQLQGDTISIPRQALPFGELFRHVQARRLLHVTVALVVAVASAALTWTSAGSRPAQQRDTQALPAQAQAVISAVLGRDDPRYGTRSAAETVTAANPRHGLAASFSRHGANVSTGAGSVSFALTGVARGEVFHRLAPARPIGRANRVEYARGALTEWYVNGPLGLEQGFTLASPPLPRSAGRLGLHLDLAGTLAARRVGGHVVFARAGTPALTYRGLAAWDAGGRPLAASLSLTGRRLVLTVDDRGARYPVTVDPFLEQASLRASDAAVADELGTAVAVSGDTIVVGAVGDGAQRGAAYVFVRPAGGWAGALTENAKLTASDGVEGDALGSAVAVGGGTIVVGAPGDDGMRGAAYVFTKPAGGWSGALSQTAKLTASARTAAALLGNAVGVDGDTAVAGAPGENGGAAYVFVEPAGGWAGALTQSARLTSSPSAAGAALGSSIAVSGSTVAAGAPGANSSRGAVYVFSKPGTGWSGAQTQSAVLSATAGAVGHQLGLSVLATDAVVVAGAPFAGSARGAAYVFVRPPAGWSGSLTESARLAASASFDSEELGISVAARGDTVAAGSWGDDAFAGAVYIFTKPAGGWAGAVEETQRLTAADAAAGDSLGGSVGFDGGTIAVGASADDGDRGSARVFALPAAGGDVSPPDTEITLTPAVPDGQDGWYRTPVHVSVAATDASGVADLRCALDPVATPTAFADLAAGCAFGGAGANVANDGAHAVYAAARDSLGNAGSAVSKTFKLDAAPPAVTCASAPTFVLGGAGGAVTATVGDTVSGPTATSVSAPADISSVGWKSVALTGFDRAGNSRTLSCRYLVGYAISLDAGFPRRPGVNAGAAVPIRFALTDAAGAPIADGAAQALSAACGVRVRLDGGAPGCARYDASSDRFVYVLKTPQSVAPGTHEVTLEVVFPGGISSTVVPLVIR